MTIVLLVIWIGVGVFALVSGLLMVAFGTSQARRAAWLIGNSPLKVLIAGFLAAVLPWILFALLSVTIIGIPLAFGLALVWGLAVFLGYLVAGLWVGEHVLRSSRNSARPYGAVFVGVLILLLLSWFPLVTFLAVWFGLGAVTMAGWRVLRGGGRPRSRPRSTASPMGSSSPTATRRSTRRPTSSRRTASRSSSGRRRTAGPRSSRPRAGQAEGHPEGAPVSARRRLITIVERAARSGRRVLASVPRRADEGLDRGADVRRLRGASQVLRSRAVGRDVLDAAHDERCRL